MNWENLYLIQSEHYRTEEGGHCDMTSPSDPKNEKYEAKPGSFKSTSVPWPSPQTIKIKIFS